jgi:putative hydrolase of the HAD superfamily
VEQANSALPEQGFPEQGRPEQGLPEQDFFDQFEKGQYSAQVFLDTLTRLSRSDEADVRKVWQAILEPIPPENLDVLARLAKRYPLYLLSNTNSLHMDWILDHLDQDHGLARFGGIFEHLFLSFEMRMRKPEPVIYQTVARQIGQLPADLLFVDDHPENVQAARDAGWEAVLHPANAPLEWTVQRWI